MDQIDLEGHAQSCGMRHGFVAATSFRDINKIGAKPSDMTRPVIAFCSAACRPMC
jgi:hypothetical protein